MVVVVVVDCRGYDSRGVQPASNVAARINTLSFLIMIISFSVVRSAPRRHNVFSSSFICFAFMLFCGFASPLASLTLVSLGSICFLRLLLLGLGLLTMARRLRGLLLLPMARRLRGLRLLPVALRLRDRRSLTMVVRPRGPRLLTVLPPLGFPPLNPPRLVSLPILVFLPGVPVSFYLFMGHVLVVPGMTPPLMVMVFMSPILGHLPIKRRDA